MLRFYGYDKCDTCRKAKKWLDARGLAYQSIDITVTPPPRNVLVRILQSGRYNLKDLFNKSGVLYREMNVKDQLAAMSESQALDLLAAHGKLCKRPIVTDGRHHTVGFDPTAFAATWK